MEFARAVWSSGFELGHSAESGHGMPHWIMFENNIATRWMPNPGEKDVIHKSMIDRIVDTAFTVASGHIRQPCYRYEGSGEYQYRDTSVYIKVRILKWGW